MSVLLGHDLRSHFPSIVGRRARGSKPGVVVGWRLTIHHPWNCVGGSGKDTRGVHIWAPPPAAARKGLGEVAMLRYKHSYAVTHILFIYQWLL